MRRRDVIAGVLAAGSPLPVLAQPAAAAPLVGWVGLASEPTDRRVLAALRQGLAEAGLVEGRSIRFAARHADGAIERAPALVAELEALGVAVFVAGGRAMARELVKATRKPIVAARLPADDRALFASLARPGGNVTGFSSFSAEMTIKQVQVLQDLLPGLSAVGILHAAAAGAYDYGSEAEAAARAIGLRTVRLPVSAGTPEETAALVRRLPPAGIRALVAVQDFVIINLRAAIARATLEEGVASISNDREFAEAGGLMSYGADNLDLFRRAGAYVDRILKGANPGDLPIQLATKFELVLNLKTARALGLTVPASLLARADEVIE